MNKQELIKRIEDLPYTEGLSQIQSKLIEIGY